MSLLIDVHSHIVPAEFPAGRHGGNGWPSMLPRDDGRADMVIDGALYRVIERGYFDLDTRLELMRHEHIDLQVVSPLPELLGYWLPLPTAVELAELVNDTIAAAVRAAPGRIEGLGMLPLQDVETAAAMVAGLAQRGLRGVHVGSSVNGRSIADPEFAPVFAELERHGLAMLVHGLRPAGAERLLGPPLMVNVVGIPQDCGSAVASFISTDVLGRFPALRIGFVHGGGTFGAILDRMEYVWYHFPKFRGEATVSPREYARRFYFDTITYSVPYLSYLVSAFGVDGMVCGTDGPAQGAQGNLEAMVVEACGGDPVAVEKVLWRNAARFLGIEPALAQLAARSGRRTHRPG